MCAGHFSGQMMDLHVDVLLVDVLAPEAIDLFDDRSYKLLLRVCFSGIVRVAAAGPPCHLYSRLRMKPGGPPPLRTPDFLNGLPGLSDRDLQRVTDSRELLTRCCQLLTAVFDSGGHVSLEQPPS